MLAVARTQIYLYNQDVDMRRSFDGLIAIIHSEFQLDVRTGDYFLFLNKRRDRAKILWWDRDGVAIFMKRLEEGTFQRPLADTTSSHSDAKSITIDQAQLAMLLSGIDMSHIKRRKRYEPTKNVAAKL